MMISYIGRHRYSWVQGVACAGGRRSALTVTIPSDSESAGVWTEPYEARQDLLVHSGKGISGGFWHCTNLSSASSQTPIDKGQGSQWTR